MKRSLLFLLALSSGFASCNSVRDIALRVSGDEGQNARTKGKGRVVYVRAYPLVGERSKAAFEKADFGQLWVDEPKVDQMVLNGDIVPFEVMPSDGGGDANAVDSTLKGVAAEVTHIGVLAMFRNCKPPFHKIVMTKDEAEDNLIVIWVNEENFRMNELRMQ